MKKLLIPLTTILVSAAILFGVSVSLSTIARENGKKEHLQIMQTLLPGSTEFTVVPYSGEDANIVSVHKGATGYVIETVTRGYVDDIRMLVSVSKHGKVMGLMVRDMHETFGLGAQALTDTEFLAQFLNSSGQFSVGEAADAATGATGASSDVSASVSVDALTGATVTSKAIARAVNSAVAYVTGADASSGATS